MSKCILIEHFEHPKNQTQSFFDGFLSSTMDERVALCLLIWILQPVVLSDKPSRADISLNILLKGFRWSVAVYPKIVMALCILCNPFKVTAIERFK